VSTPIDFPAGGYRYIPGFFQYSGGVAALDGFELVRVRFLRPPPLAEAFAAVEAHLTAVGRPSTAFAHCELRAAEPFSDEGFVAFNRQYVATLERWGLYRDGVNPVARTNVCPVYGKPAEPAMFAFCYTVPAAPGRHRSFMLAGAGDARPGTAPYSERIVRYGETSPDALREKVRFVVHAMQGRLATLGFDWSDAVLTQAYTVHDIGPLVGEELAVLRVMDGGLLWHYARPPVKGLEFEMDVCGVGRGEVL
jgi:hypothetical protein